MSIHEDPDDPCNWTWLPVTEILRGIKYSLDGYDWFAKDYVETDDDRTAFLQGMIAFKAADDGFGYLVESIRDNGWLAPIEYDPDEGRLGNGHHRLVAAILLCEDEIPTTTTDLTCYSPDRGVFDWDQEECSSHDEESIRACSVPDFAPEYSIDLEV